ncbi:hypothetical protein [Duganella sp. BJB476]|uniref:hypothetical protein n=1 Tax=Duganella sp. BJB476 TaxID=1871176 RepID=UPI000E35260A|nr:hypothetical protein [Duganella sp. BJB476]RFP32462.1 hypothetical protein D0T21_09695 [Duganella sp. BJB476]
MIIDDIMTDKITLHGLGFVQVQLPGNQRIHVWHPDLPRRSCFEHSAIHNHRFGFRSIVLVGEQINIPVEVIPNEAGSHILYLHEGARTANGGRPWVPDGRVDLVEHVPDSIMAGRHYHVRPYDYHRTAAGGNGQVATLLTKIHAGYYGAHSSCAVDVEPDADFDRFQWAPSRLWEVVSAVLTGGVA